MSVSKGKVTLYGLDDLDEKADSIIEALNLNRLSFEIKLIIFEAVSNAFIHGNDGDKNKPISLQWYLKDNLLRVYVTDCGNGFKDLPIYNKEGNDCNLLEEGGRGLYIIRSYTDEIQFEGNSIIMKKYI